MNRMRVQPIPVGETRAPIGQQMRSQGICGTVTHGRIRKRGVLGDAMNVPFRVEVNTNL